MVHRHWTCSSIVEWRITDVLDSKCWWWREAYGPPDPRNGYQITVPRHTLAWETLPTLRSPSPTDTPTSLGQALCNLKLLLPGPGGIPCPWKGTKYHSFVLLA